MAFRSLEDRRAYGRQWYQANKESRIANAKGFKKRLQQSLRDLKESQPCKDCNISYPYYVMQFDHLRDKKDNIASLVRLAKSRALREELEKCELVCANCHAVRTHKRRISIAGDAPVL